MYKFTATFIFSGSFRTTSFSLAILATELISFLFNELFYPDDTNVVFIITIYDYVCVY